MSTKQPHKQPTKHSAVTSSRPFVSICTPTFNRRPFIPTMLACFRHQTYPRDRMEWIILDDGTDKIRDLITAATDLQKTIRYFDFPTKMKLGHKRNKMHDYCRGDIIVYMDDDDYYPPERVSHAVETLQNNPRALCAGSSVIHIYFKHIQKMVQFGPYGPSHATAGTFAFRKELLRTSRYNDDACLAEERQFLKDYTVPFVQLDPLKTILVISHIHNTFDKRRLLDDPSMGIQMSSGSALTVDHFIQSAAIKQFFLHDIEEQLAHYDAGQPVMKPDVLLQIEQMDKQRTQQMQPPTTGQTPTPLKMEQVVEILKQQEQILLNLQKKIQQQDQYISQQADVIFKLQEQQREQQQREQHQSKPSAVTNKTDPER